jgi:lipopolysaccharide export system permease protein
MMQTILDRYIAKTVLMAICMVTLMLVGLQIFMLLVDQLGDLGRGDYGIKEALVFMLLQMPYQVYLFFPIASLLGCLIGLGVMANHSELVVMRAVGLSIGQITMAVLKASLVVILIVTVLGETVIPFLSHYSRDYKVQAITGGQGLRTSGGIWLRFGNDFVTIGVVDSDTLLHNIYQFHFDEQHHLEFSRFIREARFAQQQWTAYDINQTNFLDNATGVQTWASLTWELPIKPQIVQLSSNEPDEMTLHELNRYIREQRQSQINVQSYQLAFYQRIIQPFTTLVMMVLAIPFIFGPLRSSTMGSKLVVGISAGFGFHLLNHFFGPLSTVYQWPTLLAAFGPTIIFAVLGYYLMRRIR